MPEESISFIPLLIVIFLALIVPILLSRVRRFRLPIVVGEIMAGIIVGRSGLQLVQEHDPVLDLLAEFGFAFLFFLGGLEIDFGVLGGARGRNGSSGWKSRLETPLNLGVATFALTLALSFATAFVLFQLELIPNFWIITLVLAPSSLGIIFAVLKESGFNTGRFGQTILVSAIVADFGTVLLLTVLVAAVSQGLTFEILLVGLIFIAFLLIYRFTTFLGRITPVRRTLEELSSATAQIKIRVAFTLLLAFVVLAEVLGAELVLGAFLAGAMLSLLSAPEDTEAIHQLEAIGFGFFIPIFFVMVGADFDIAALLESPQALLLVPVLLVAAFGVKLVPVLLFRLNFPWQETLAAGVLLSTRLSLVIAEGAIALQLELIDAGQNAAIILVAMILATIAPLVFNRAAPKRARDEGVPGYIIAGANALGLQVAQQLLAHNEKVLVIDQDEVRVRRALGQGVEAIQANLDRSDSRAEEYLDNAHTLISTTSNPERNYLICKVARTVFGINNVVTSVSEPNQLPRFEQLGVKTLNPALDQGSFLTMLARNPGLYGLLTRTDDDKDVYEITVRSDAQVGRPLYQLAFPGDVHVVAVQRNGEMILPNGQTQLERGDRITLVGSLGCLEEALRMFAG